MVRQRQQHPVQQAHAHQLRVRAAELQRHPAGDPGHRQARLAGEPWRTATASRSRSRSAAGTTATTRRSRRWPATPAPAPPSSTAWSTLVNQYNLDGVDIDWEYPDPGTSGNNYTALMSQLSTAMHSRGKLLTAAVVSEGGTANGVQPAVFGYVDWLNIMAYDGGSPHANYDWSIASANFWKDRGLPASKTVLGVPFYSRPELPDVLPARRRWTRPTPTGDCVTVNGAQQCYNGIPTIKRKTQWAMANAGGIMNWELSQDTTGATSLVSAIYDADGRHRATRRPAGPARSPASAASASTSPAPTAPTVPPSSSGPATAPTRRPGRSAPTARSGPWASAWTSPPPVRRTARWSSSTTATAPAPRSWQAAVQRHPAQPGVRPLPGRHRPELGRRHPAADLGLLDPQQPGLDPPRLSCRQPTRQPG